MARREKIGLFFLIVLFVSLGMVLVFTVERPSKPGRGFKDNVVVEQRVRNLRNR